MKTKILRLLLLAVLLVPFVASAQANPCTGGRNANLGQCVSQVYVWSLGLSGILAVCVCVWGGYMVMTARGNAAQASSGKSYIYSALVGMVLLFGAYILLNTINPDLTDFTTPDLGPLNPPAANNGGTPAPAIGN